MVDVNKQPTGADLWSNSVCLVRALATAFLHTSQKCI